MLKHLSVVALSLLTSGPLFAAGISGTATISYLCAISQTRASLRQPTISGASGDLVAACPNGEFLFNGNTAEGIWSASGTNLHPTLSINGTGRDGGSAYVAGSVTDAISVFNVPSGYIAMTGLVTIQDATAVPTYLNAVINFGANSMTTQFGADNASVWIAQNIVSSTRSTITDTPIAGGLQRAFTFYVPFTSGQRIGLDVGINSRAGDYGTQSTTGNLTYTLGIVDSGFNPVAGTILFASNGTLTPEPGSAVLLLPGIFLLWAGRKRSREEPTK